MPKTPFSLLAFLNEVLPGLGPEFSWDFKVDATVSRFTVRILIRLYGDRKSMVQERILDAAKKFDFEVSSLYQRDNYDLVLERSFSDITGEPLAQKR